MKRPPEPNEARADPKWSALSPTRLPDDDTGLPGLRTWRFVYWAVIIFFAVCVVLLALLSGVHA